MNDESAAAIYDLGVTLNEIKLAQEEFFKEFLNEFKEVFKELKTQSERLSDLQNSIEIMGEENRNASYHLRRMAEQVAPLQFDVE